MFTSFFLISRKNIINSTCKSVYLCFSKKVGCILISNLKGFKYVREKHFQAQSILYYLAIYAIIYHILILLERILSQYFDQNSRKSCHPVGCQHNQLLEKTILLRLFLLFDLTLFFLSQIWVVNILLACSRFLYIKKKKS